MEVIPYEIPLGTAKIGPHFEFKCAKKNKNRKHCFTFESSAIFFFFLTAG